MVYDVAVMEELSSSVDQRVIRVARELASDLADRGAQAVVLSGSHVRGDAHTESDIDLFVVGRGPSYRLERRGEFLVATSWSTERRYRAAFRSPASAGGAVPCWRQALIIRDPHGVAAALQQEARGWRWESIDKRCDSWVAEEITGYAEEVHRLVGQLELGHELATAVQRSVLALRLAQILAVHLRILYETENVLWDAVGERMGGEWRRAQAAALGVTDAGFEETCRAALRLYVLAAEEAGHLLDGRQRAVVEHACALASREHQRPH